MNRLLLFLSVLLLIPLTSQAQTPEPYAVLSEENTVLTFYYDGKKAERSGLSVGPFEEKDIRWNGYGDVITKVIFDKSFKSYNGLTSTAYWFSWCCSLAEIVGQDNLNTQNVTDMSYMFENCNGLSALDLRHFNTQKVVDMSSMFSSCAALESLNLSSFNTENVTRMDGMFYECVNLATLDVSNFDTKNVVLMHGMFKGCERLTSLDVSHFDTRNVTDMGSLFCSCPLLTSLNLSLFDTSNVTDMSAMFDGCSGLKTLDLKNFDTRKVTNMDNMFVGCSSLESIALDNFNTENVEMVSYMFSGCAKLATLDVSNFNTAKVWSFNGMFEGCSSLTSLDVSGFDVSKATELSGMFSGCESLTELNVSNFDVAKVSNMTGMFSDCHSLVTIYGDDVWDCENSANMFYGCVALKGAIEYSPAHDKVDVTYANPTTGYFTSTGVKHLRPYAVLSDDNTVLTFYYDDHKMIRHGLTVEPFTDEWACSWSSRNSYIKSVVFDKTFGDYTGLTSTAYWFKDCNRLLSLKGIENLKTDNVTDMKQMFYGCHRIMNLDLSKFNTSKVANMNEMFANCNMLEKIYCNDIWVTTQSENMFMGCPRLAGNDGTQYNSEKVTVDYAKPEGGYFTRTLQAIDGKYWMTYYTTEPVVKVDESTKVFVGELNDAKNELTLREIESGFVAGSNGVILVSDIEAPMLSLYEFKGVMEVGDYSNNALRGSDDTIETSSVSSVDGTVYTLAVEKEPKELGFFKYKGEKLLAHKAYLAIPSSQDAIRMVFDDNGFTGIKDTQRDDAKKAERYFDLQGRPVANPTKGLYIVNGKKIVKK